jgi:hypothetical protein
LNIFKGRDVPTLAEFTEMVAQFEKGILPARFRDPSGPRRRASSPAWRG